MNELTKQPLGIEPKYIWETKRAQDLRDAIYRYVDKCCVIPVKWIEEYNDLVKRGALK